MKKPKVCTSCGQLKLHKGLGIIYDGIEYESLNEAARQLNTKANNLLQYVKKGIYNGKKIQYK